MQQRHKIPYRALLLGAGILGFSILVLGRAQAGGSHFFPPVADAVVKEECGSCHLAFPASMLPANSWQRMMGELKNHFGDDASVDAATTKVITDYLVANAGDMGGQRYGEKLLRGLQVSAPTAALLRITELPRWVREHRKISERDWRKPAVGSKANCTACHTDAPAGYFDD